MIARADSSRERDAEPQVAITLDVDWAPDFMIDAAADVLVRAGVCATWFVTHRSPAIERLAARSELFELGWHPNFFAGSSHGSTEAEVLAHCETLVPGARAVRMHGLLQSTRLLNTLREQTGIRIDASQLLRRHAHLAVHALPLAAGVMHRVPFWWEDDVEILAHDACWDLATALNDGVPGLRVLNFHPVHIALDSHRMHTYGQLKQRVPSLERATPADVLAVRHARGGHDGAAQGTARAFDDAVAWLSRRGGGQTISTLVSRVTERR